MGTATYSIKFALTRTFQRYNICLDRTHAWIALRSERDPFWHWLGHPFGTCLGTWSVLSLSRDVTRSLFRDVTCSLARDVTRSVRSYRVVIAKRCWMSFWTFRIRCAISNALFMAVQWADAGDAVSTSVASQLACHVTVRQHTKRKFHTLLYSEPLWREHF